MKKYILIICLFIFYLGGCTENVNTESASNELLETTPINRVISAADVDGIDVYNFAVSNDVKDELPTFKMGDKLTITANDSQEYSLFYSKDKEYDISSLAPNKFTIYLNLTTPEEGYYTLVSEDKNIDATISTL